MNTSSPLLTGLDLTQTPSASLLARLGRRLMLERLAEFTRGELRVVEPNGNERIFGRRDGTHDIGCTLFIDHPQTWADAAFGGTVGAGEAYIRGLWRCDDLTSLVRIFVANRDVMNRMDSRWSFVSRPLLKLFHWANRNSRHGSARNIAAHYDLGNEFFALWLDPSMMYSGALWPAGRPQLSLEEAQREKNDALCRHLRLQPTDHVLEIGTGLGFQTALLARLAARVISIERWPDLAGQARPNLARQGLGNAEVLAGDGSRGLPEGAPYDAILVSAAFPQVPAPLAAQLRIGGRLVQPIGPGGSEQVVLFERSASGLERRHVLTLARFVRLHGRHGSQSRS
jgi:protein-L-isoaspartate(D-aspartate) O-methyltransferase